MNKNKMIKPKQKLCYLIATYSFTCPITGTRIYKGENYAEIEGLKVSIEAVNLIEE